MHEAELIPVGVPYLREIIVFLCAAVLLVPVFQYFKASPVLGYLLVGAMIGPAGFGVISDPEGVSHLAELGVVFLLFTIGLDLSFDRLRQMARMVFGLGGAQVGVSGIVIAAIAWYWGNSVEAAIILGFCLALSSTAIVVQLLIERGEFNTRAGRASFAILLFQDLAVVPLLVLVTVFSGDGEGSLVFQMGFAFAKALFAVGLILIAGRFVLRYLYRVVTWTRSPELFMALTLLAILGTALVTGSAGLSMPLGAFLAGLLIAETEFRHQVETDIQPFKGLLLGLFFISVGMGLNFGLVADQYFWIIASVVGLVVLKAVITTILGLMFGLPLEVSLRTGIILGEGGEFALVVVGAAMAGGILSVPVGQFMMIVAGLTMAATPFLVEISAFLKRTFERREGATSLSPDEGEMEEFSGHVLIAGYGRVGQTVAKLLNDQKVPYVALDLNVPRARACRERGEPVFYADAARVDILARMGIERASAVVITLDNFAASSRALKAIRELWPNVPIFVRSRDMSHTEELKSFGATGVVPETFESSLQLSGQVLHALGTPMDAVNGIIDRIREEDYEPLKVTTEQ